jgi:hypothetical protein
VLFNGNSNLVDLLSGLSKLLNGGWWSLNSFIDFIEALCDQVVLLFCFRSNQLDLVLNNLLVLACVKISDIINRYQEYSNCDRFGNLFFEIGFELSNSVNVCSQTLSINGFFTLLEASDVSIRIELIFSLKLAESLSVCL